MLTKIWLKISYEPAMFLEIFKQVINGLILFNIWKNPDPQQVAFINIFSGMLLQWFVRATSFPSAKVVDAVGTEKAKDIAATRS